MSIQSLSDTRSHATGVVLVDETYEHEDTLALVTLVDAAAELVYDKGAAAFEELRAAGSRWRAGEQYVFVLDMEGNMLVHPDPALEGRNMLALKDIDGRPITRGLIAAVAEIPNRPAGWYHYQWPVPGGLLPRWKSSFVRRVHADDDRRYIVGSGMYNDRMERAFVVDLVARAVAELERRGRAGFPALYDPKGQFLVKDAYVFVDTLDGVELVNPAFPNLKGRKLLDLTDADGRYLVREMLDLLRTRGQGWVDYLWPRPGESVSTRKSAYVRRAMLDGTPVLVGCGVYLADAPREQRSHAMMSAPALAALVREAAVLLEQKGEDAYRDFARPGSRWHNGGTYLFVVTADGTAAFHAADPSQQGRDLTTLHDVLGRPIGRMILEAGAGPAGEGWIHYMYPEPGGIFPAWKSTFVRRAILPDGEARLVGCGIHHMQMDRVFIEDVVERAAALVAAHGPAAFPRLRDRTGPFVFMDTYVFVLAVDGTELVNAGVPALEGRNLLDVTDLNGKPLVREEIFAAMLHGRAWLDYHWFRPGSNEPARKLTYVRRVEAEAETYIVGSGIYVD
jgi:signal transduction histidine kinase